MRNARRVAGALLVAVAMAFTGCSGDDDQESTPDGSSVESPDTSARVTNTTADPGLVTPTTS